MSEEKNKSGLHIHLGGLIIIVIIVLLLFSTDLKSVLDSPQLNENITYLKERSVKAWDKYFSEPINSKINDFFNGLVDKGAEEIKEKGSFFTLPELDDGLEE
ncbi:MAG: hypothetical protein PHT84_00880 [Candidatus Pacebacteria bacterium]|nr:hypothetical protein [Candidatus Paceibacterota bacterium]